ncbi:pumilio homolog 12 isoform X2 [Malania oleifera]|nr:pumilio homolog 12 isoform X2 [Malania oleifera]XP_057955819.1 pumilio homolog 12 isoform X2 [Malania oleifera]
MGERRNEPEFDELEILLGEIPTVTSGNPHSEDSGLNTSSKDFQRVSLHDSLSHEIPRPVCVNSSEGSFHDKLQSYGIVEDGKMPVNNVLQSPIKRFRQEGQNLPDDQSLTSALSKLNFGEGVTVDAVNPNFVVYKSLVNNTVMLDDQYPNGLKKPPSVMDSQIMAVHSPESPNSSLGGFNEFDVERSRRECSNLLKFNVQELKKQPFSYSEHVQNFTSAMPFAHGVQGFQFLSDMTVPHVEFPVMANQQQYFLEAQSRLQYLHSQQLSQPHITWSHMEEEQYYRMHQQNLYLQQLWNQNLEARPPIQANGNVSTRLIGRKQMQPYYEMPVPQQYEQCNQKSYWNSYAVRKGLNQTSPAISSTDYTTPHILDKIGKQFFPEKILTRSHGLNSIRSVKFGTIGGNESVNSFNHNPLSNGNFRHSLSTSNAACFHSDSLSSLGLLAETTDVKHNNQRLQSYLLDEVSGKIYLMAKDQNGCRFLQRKFMEGTPEDVEKIFVEIIDHIVELMTDPFGNYLVQKLLEVCDEDQQMQILHAITRKAGDLVRISCDVHGTRAVQKAIETLKTPEQFSMVVSSLKPGIVTLMKNMNGNHVAQRCLQYLLPEYSEFLFEAATANCVELATDRHGCCVLQKCLSHSDGEQRRRLICEITSNALILSQDPFGNYVVQFVFELQVPWATMDILGQLEGNYGDLSVQKCSSNVVEKCLKYAGEECRLGIIQELINNPRLDQIMQDPYGNYVIQAALNYSKGALHAALVEAIKPHVSVLRTSPYGKKVLSSYSLRK